MTVIVEAGPFNGPDDADSVMNWVDITAYVNDNLQAPTSSVGRQTELQQVNPGSLSLILNNRDHRFTPGNPTSPYYPGWRTGMRIRARETIGYQTFSHFDGNMLQPDVTVQTADLDQTVTVNATDRLGRLKQARTFISTLAEYVIFNGGSLLKAYYPLGDGRAPFRDVVGGQPGLAPFPSPSTLANTVSLPAAYSPAQGGAPGGDDLQALSFAPSSTPSGDISALVNSWGIRQTNTRAPISIPTGQSLTAVFWINMSTAWNDLQQIFSLNLTSASISELPVVQLFRNNYSALTTNLGRWDLLAFDGGGTYQGEVVGPQDTGGRWMPVGVQWNYSQAALRLWLDTQSEFSVAPGGGTLTEPFKINGRQSIGPISGAVSHFQIYVGNYTRAQFLAQRDAGLTGLAGQYTGQRISTIGQYAGMAVGDMDIDAGTSRMQKATLAGRLPLDVMQEAATTEQGLLHAAGRRLLFHDRLRRYNR